MLGLPFSHFLTRPSQGFLLSINWLHLSFYFSNWFCEENIHISSNFQNFLQKVSEKLVTHTVAKELRA